MPRFPAGKAAGWDRGGVGQGQAPRWPQGAPHAGVPADPLHALQPRPPGGGGGTGARLWPALGLPGGCGGGGQIPQLWVSQGVPAPPRIPILHLS